VIVWVVADGSVDGCETLSSLRQAETFMRLGLRLHDTMIFSKANMFFHGPTHRKYCGAWEYMFIVSKGRPKVFNAIKDRTNLTPGTSYRSVIRDPDGSLRYTSEQKRITPEVGYRNNVWAYHVGALNGAESAYVFEHPATFPEALAKDHIKTWSNPGDLVIDPFSGSGTTCLGAKELGRRFIGIECSQAYVDLANTRLRQEVMEIGV
jgi:DNA modification methylase